MGNGKVYRNDDRWALKANIVRSRGGGMCREGCVLASVNERGLRWAKEEGGRGEMVSLLATM